MDLGYCEVPCMDCSITSGYDSQELFDAAKETEMSVSDPEEYLVSRSDEDTTLYTQHSMFMQ